MKKKSSIIKTVIIIILAVIIVAESFLLIFREVRSKDPQINVSLTLSIDGMGDSIGSAVGKVLGDTLTGLKSGALPKGGISPAVKEIVYSDLVVSMVASIGLPLLYQTLVGLRMLDFATNMDLFATGPLFAGKLEGKAYTCVDKDGTRKPLTDVLNAVGENWEYMNEKVSYTDEDGKNVETTLWNSIQWGVSDEATFYAALSDIGEALRGALEVSLQGRERVVNVNVPEVILGTDSLPINMDAATIFNATGAGGYEKGLIPLFNALGLEDGDYPSVEEFNAYESTADIWKAIFGSVFKVLEKIESDPVNRLTSLLVNFADIVDSGRFKEMFSTLRLDAEFNKLASMAMDFHDGLLFNVGEALLKIVEETGLNLSGNFNDLLDSTLKVLTKKEGNLPDLDVAALKGCASEKTLPNGNKVLVADSEKVLNFLVNYAMDDELVRAVVNATELGGTPEGEKIIAAASKSEEGLRELVNAILPLILNKLKSA